MGLTPRHIRRLIERVKLAGASGTGQAVEPTDPGDGQDQGAEEVVRAAPWRFWADVGGGEAGRVHGITINAETVRGWLRDAGLDHFTRRTRPHRAWRERRAHVGELVQLDGSHHNWFEGRGSRYVRMASIDEASSRV
ncbi:MAG: hypothetical protein ABIO96_11065 [Nitrospiraceae bacterium]